MTVSTQNLESAEFLGDGVITELPFNFNYDNEDDVKIFQKLADGTFSEIMLDRTVERDSNNSESGKVVLASPLDNGLTVKLVRITAKTQLREMSQHQPYYPETHERGYDKNTMLIQELCRRVFKTPSWFSGNLEFPVPYKSGNVLTTDGDRLLWGENVGNPDDLTNVQIKTAMWSNNHVTGAIDFTDGAELVAYGVPTKIKTARIKIGTFKGLYTWDASATTGINPTGNTGAGRWVEERETVKGESDRKYNLLAGGYNSLSIGSVEWINDAGHRPSNFNAITLPDDFTVRLPYSKTTPKISSMIVGADDALAKHGWIGGGDVGDAFANITSFAPLSFLVSGEGVVTESNLFEGHVTASVSANTITVTHPRVGSPITPASVGCVSGSTMAETSHSFGNTSTIIRLMTEMNGFVQFVTSWAWVAGLSDNVSSPTAFDFIGGNLRVTHADPGGESNIQLTQHGGTSYHPVVENITNTYFEVGFYNPGGTKITVPDNKMRFWYKRGCKVQKKIPTGLLLTVNRGHTAVPNSGLANVAGSNPWVIGINED